MGSECRMHGTDEKFIPLGIPGRRWEENIRIDHTERGCRTGFIWLRIVNSG
jgi:hypothetical protein